MSLNENLASDIQKLDPSAMIELFELDTTDLGGDIIRFHAGTNKLNQNIVWQGNEYNRFPIEVTGFEISGQGQFPRPQVKVSNVMSAITIILMQYGDLLGAKFTRKRTLAKYLDAINFPGNVNPDADPGVYFADDIYYVDRKSSEDRDIVQFELASVADLQGVKIPARTVVKNLCPWVYRGADCGFTGIPLYDENDNILPYPASAEAIAMRDAYQDVLDAKALLAIAQADLEDKYDILLAAEQYTQTIQISLSSPKYYIATAPFAPTLAYWNDVDVIADVGTLYQSGDYYQQQTINGNLYTFYKIIQNYRDEAALAIAQANYDAAVIARDNAIADVDTAIADFDTALAAVPADDPVYTQDRCGKRLTSCKNRFSAIIENSPINFGGFPGVSR
jgi:lambda family phage minor tail protein L